MTDSNPPPKPPPPVVGKVTHYSIELYWDDALERLQQVTHGVGGRIRVVLQEKTTPSVAEWGNVYTGFGKRHMVESLDADKLYTYRMCFKNDFGASEWSSPVDVRTTKEPFTGEHLHRAIRRNDVIELRKILEDRSANIEATDRLGFTPLMQAAQKGSTEMIELLLNHGADVNGVTDANKTALMQAAFSNQVETCHVLIERGAIVGARDKSGSTALHAAVDGQAVDAIELLIREKADVNAADYGSKWTPLIRCAATNGNSRLAKLFVKGGADLNAQDSDGKTALMVACINGHQDLVRLLLENGADLRIENEYGKTAFDFACSMERYGVIKIMEEEAQKIGIKLIRKPTINV